MHPPGARGQGMARSGEPANVLLTTKAPQGSDSYFALPNKNQEAESRRKSWGERWRLGRSPKQEDTMQVQSHFMIHPDYARKYGTISPGVLARSVKYAETWLYGTVAVRGAAAQRPSLFLYPGMVAPPRGDHRQPVPRFLPAPHGSQRTTRNLCQCVDTPRGALCRQCGVRRSRPQTRSRQALLNTTTQEEPRLIPAAADPYNLMRKSRLGVGETTETSIINPKTKQKRNRSSSPTRKENSSFETFKPKLESTWVNDSQAWESDSDCDDHRKRSILACNVTAYDLNEKEDSSDELSDGTLEIKSKLKILRPKLKKTDGKYKKIEIPEPKKLPDPEVRLSGQRFKIFGHSSPSTKVERSVSEEAEELPKRPPRRPKQNGRLGKFRSTSSPNLSIKSILKKPCEDGSDSSLNDSTPPDSGEIGKVFDLRVKKVSQSTLKKKKQVQFRVNSSENVAEPKEETVLDVSSDCSNVVEVSSDVSLVEIACVVEVEVANERKEEVKEEEEDDEKNVTGNEVSVVDRMGECEENGDAIVLAQAIEEPLATPIHQVTLKRSYSDRRPSAAVVKCGGEVVEVSTSPPNSFLFSDTMALRQRTSRHDTRELFLDNLDESLKQHKKRPREPPPPPPIDPPPDPPPTTRPPPKVLESIVPPVKLCNNCEGSKGKTVVKIGGSEDKERRTSIIINGPESTKRTSVIINNFPLPDTNKVTINVTNEEDVQTSCSTIIETGWKTTVIPVVSTDNKTTLTVEPSKPAPYIFSSSTLLDNMDPVEAVRRNLVPHVCGKEDPALPSLVERLKGEKTLPESLLAAYQARKWKSLEESSTPTSRSSSFSRRTSSRNTSRSSSFNDSCTSRSKFYLDETVPQELDKLEDEYVIQNGLKKDDDVIYETIKEPIYDQIGLKLKEEESDEDVPPPLPTSLPPTLEELEHRTSKSIFEGASKYDILSYLVDAKDRVQEDIYMIDRVDHRRMESLDGSEISTGKASDSGVDAGPPSSASDSSEDRDSLLLGRKSSADIERNDSGVGSETSQTCRSKWQNGSLISSRDDPLCEDCDQTVETQVTDGGVMYAPLICRKCAKKRNERKEIIQEIVDTEEKYGRDLRITLEEFYKPMLVAGLLTPDQLGAIFLNVEELLDNSDSLTEKLKDTLEIATEQGDEDFLTVNIGRLFLDAKPMLHGFESYCTRQASAAVLLANLEKEKELLRIFLRVSQMENAVLRRMNLNSFLMVPVQRVTKYPLLLARLYKVTPGHHECREMLKEAQHAIELHLEHMNAEAKDGGGTRVWRRFSTSTVRKTTAELELTSIKIRKLAVDVLEWSHDEVRFVLEGRLLFAQPDSNWKRGRTVKLQPVFALLATLGKPNSKYRADIQDGGLAFPSKTGVREATLLLVKEKCGRFTLIREPLYLDKLIVCCEADNEDLLEVQELSTKETFLFKGEDVDRTKEWYRQLQYHAQILGGWRKRRNALANIMITGISYAS